MKLTAAAVAVLLAASLGYSQTSESEEGNCYRYATDEELVRGLPSAIPSDYCSADGGDYCFHKVAPNEFVHVDRCTKDDLFDEETRP